MLTYGALEPCRQITSEYLSWHALGMVFSRPWSSISITEYRSHFVREMKQWGKMSLRNEPAHQGESVRVELGWEWV